MKHYKIVLNGCDDTTEFEMMLSDEEVTLVKRICDLSEQTSTYGCMPVMEMRQLETEEDAK